MSRWLVFLIAAIFLLSSALGCGEPKKDPALKDKDKPKPAENAHRLPSVGWQAKTPLNFLQAGRTAGPEQRRGQLKLAES